MSWREMPVATARSTTRIGVFNPCVFHAVGSHPRIEFRKDEIERGKIPVVGLLVGKKDPRLQSDAVRNEPFEAGGSLPGSAWLFSCRNRHPTKGFGLPIACSAVTGPATLLMCATYIDARGIHW